MINIFNTTASVYIYIVLSCRNRTHVSTVSY